MGKSGQDVRLALPISTITISNYRYIPPARKQLLCRLSLTLKNHEIAFHAGTNICTVQHFLKLWRQTGGVNRNRKPLNGGRREFGLVTTSLYVWNGIVGCYKASVSS
jgi:hypothetical protein